MRKTTERFLPYAIPAAAVALFLTLLIGAATIGLTYAVDYVRHGQPPTTPSVIPAP